MKTQFTERSEVNCMSEFDPALIFVDSAEREMKSGGGIYPLDLTQVLVQKLVLDLIRRRQYNLKIKGYDLRRFTS